MGTEGIEGVGNQPAYAPGKSNKPEDKVTIPGPFDIVTHHNQDLDVWDALQKEGKLKKGAVLIHADTHSDFYTCTNKSESIGSYINAAISNGTVSEVYWVMPDFLKPEHAPEGRLTEATANGILTENAPMNFFIYENNGEIYDFKPLDYDGKTHKKIAFHIVHVSELPEFSAEKRDVILDVDADFFSVSDTERKYIPSKSELEKNIGDFFRTVASKKISPAVSLLARSPGYTIYTDIKTIEGGFRKCFDGKELIPDSAASYRHEHGKASTFEMLYKIKEKLGLSKAVSNDELEYLHNFGYGDIELAIRTLQDEGKGDRQKIVDNIVSITGKDYVTHEKMLIEMMMKSEIFKKITEPPKENSNEQGPQ